MGERSILTMSELQAFCEEGRRAFHDAALQLGVTAEELRSAIEAYAMSKGLGVRERRMLVAQVLRPLRHAAALQDEAAKAITTAYTRALRAFDAVEDRGVGTGKAFDPKK